MCYFILLQHLFYWSSGFVRSAATILQSLAVLQQHALILFYCT